MGSILRTRLLVLSVTALMLGLQAGCVSSTTNPPRAHSGFQPGDLPAANSSDKPSPEELTSKDRCPARLHEIEGALLEFYAVHRQLPQSLSDLHSLEPTLELNCPESNLPYVYVPAGLRKPGGTRRIVVHDPVRHRDGTRWCIMMVDTPPGKSQQTLVVQLPEPLFNGYQ
jgi:hypothetical protein